MGIYERASSTAKEPIVKPAERHKHKNGANIQKENTKLTKQKQCGGQRNVRTWIIPFSQVRYPATFALSRVDTVPLFVKCWRVYTHSRLKHVDENKSCRKHPTLCKENA